MQSGREQEMRRVSFAHGLYEALHVEQSDDLIVHVDEARLEQSGEPIVQIVCGDIHVDGELSGDAWLGQSLVEVTVIELEMDAFRFDVSDALEVYSDLDTAVQDILRLQR